MEAAFRALAHPGRRHLLDQLRTRDGQTLTQLCEALARDGSSISRQAVTRHLEVLQSADLVTTVWRGREKLHYLNAAPLQAITDRWLRRFDRRRIEALADLTHALENHSMTDRTAAPEFVYVTYIHATAEQVWTALTDPAFTTRYWGAALESDWQVGSTIDWVERGVRVADPEQKVLESERPHRLAYTWHTVTEEFAEAIGMDADHQQKLAKESRSHVRFTIEPAGERVKLTLEHTGFDPGSLMLQGVTQGWPAILANLKTLLETGSPMPEPQPA